MSKVHARSHEITNKPLRVRTTKTLPTIMLRSVPQMLKRWRIIVNRISKERQTTCNWIKKILDEATRIVNVFLIPWFFYLFLSCSISLLEKYDFILRYCGSFIVNFSQISANQSLSNEMCSEPPTKSTVLYNRLSAKLASKIPAKFQRNRPFFLRICPWKSREIWLFFRDLQEALI